MSKSTPPAPDYTSAAQAQGAANKDVATQQTWANRPNVNTPWGTSSWTSSSTTDPSTGAPVTNWQNNINLTPSQQQALDSQQNMQTQRSDFANSLLGDVQKNYAPGSGLDWSALPANDPNVAGSLKKSAGSPDAYMKSSGDAIYGQWANRNEPLMARAEDATRARLYAQGLREGDTAFKTQIGDLGNQQSDARLQASLAATSGAGADASRVFGMNQSNAQLNNTAVGQQQALISALRQQGIQEGAQKQNQPLNAMNALLTGQQVQNPTFSQAPQATGYQAPDLLGATKSSYGAALDAANAQNAGTSATYTGLGSLAAMAAMYFSDRRTKEDITPIGKLDNGLTVYKFRYKGDPRFTIGVMADEVEQILPEAVGEFNGIKMVNYGAL